MADEKATPSKATQSKATAPKQEAKAPDLSPSDAEAPGPITPEHESGSWEQTLEDRGE